MKVYQTFLISFESEEKGFLASIPLQDLDGLGDDPAGLLKDASRVYQSYICGMSSIAQSLESSRKARTPIPARRVWELGNKIFELRRELLALSFEVDDLYGHLERDLRSKRKWIEKVIILRRYAPLMEIIPESTNWGKLEKGTRKVVQKLAMDFQNGGATL